MLVWGWGLDAWSGLFGDRVLYVNKAINRHKYVCRQTAQSMDNASRYIQDSTRHGQLGNFCPCCVSMLRAPICAML